MIGIDLVDLRRIHLNPPLIKKVLSEQEQDVFNGLCSDKAKIEYLGGRFAAKEAIYKATQAEDYLAYSILNHPDGRPYVAGHAEIEISISHDGDYAIAMVMIR